MYFSEIPCEHVCVSGGGPQQVPGGARGARHHVPAERRRPWSRDVGRRGEVEIGARRVVLVVHERREERLHRLLGDLQT